MAKAMQWPPMGGASWIAGWAWSMLVSARHRWQEVVTCVAIVTAAAASHSADLPSCSASTGVRPPAAHCACHPAPVKRARPAPTPPSCPACQAPARSACDPAPAIYPMLLLREPAAPPPPAPAASPPGDGAGSACNNTLKFHILGAVLEGSGQMALMMCVLALGAVLVLVVAIVTLWTTFKGGRKTGDPTQDAALNQKAVNTSLRWRVGLLGVGALIVISLFWLASRTGTVAAPPPVAPGVFNAPADQLARLGEQMASLQESQRLLLGRPAADAVGWPTAWVGLLAGLAGSALVMLVALGMRQRRPDAMQQAMVAATPTTSAAPSPELRALRARLQDRMDEVMGQLDGWLPARSAAPAPATDVQAIATPATVDLSGLLTELATALALLDPLTAPVFDWRLRNEKAYPAPPLQSARTELSALFDEIERLLAADAALRLGTDALADAFRRQLRRVRALLLRCAHQPPG